MNPKLVVCFCLAPLWFAPFARASVVEGLPLQELTTRADEVVVGRVASVATLRAPEGSHLFRRVLIDVDERWKGSGPAQVTLLLRGGDLDGLSEQVIGLPDLETGDRAVWFLRGVGGAHRLVGMGQGAFFDDGAGNYAQRLAGLSLAAVTGHRLTLAEHGGAPLVPAMPLTALHAQVRRLVTAP